jgi:hypothetical protein
MIRLLLPILIALLAGCATASKTSLPRASAPADALITQRGVLKVLGRQFTLNGYVALSAAGGKRLIVTENFGSVLADVLVKPDGSVHVMRSSRAFKPEWIRNHLAADLECLFGNGPREHCPGEQVGPDHYRITRRWYSLELRTVETKPGTQPVEMFDAGKAEKP